MGNIIQSSTPYKYGEIGSQVENPLFAGLTMGSGREGDVADWGNGEGIFYIFFGRKIEKSIPTSGRLLGYYRIPGRFSCITTLKLYEIIWFFVHTSGIKIY